MIEIRPAVPKDAPAVAEINVRSWQAAYRGLFPDDFLDALQPHERLGTFTDLLHRGAPRPGFVAAVGHQVAGFVLLGPPMDPALDPDSVHEVYSMHVEPDRVGTGMGRLLMDETLRHLRSGGWSSAVLWVLRDACRARRFYEAAGWNPDGAETTREIPEGHPVGLVRYRIDL